MEGLAHRHVSMLTLTYATPNLPLDESLCPADLAGFLKRLRRNYERARRWSAHNAPAHLRFFAVGEYGGKFGRPHYHLIALGADRSTFVNGEPFSRLVRRSWGLGSTHLGGGWNANTAAYVSGYVAKGFNVAGNSALQGRHPEFSRWPTRPGLGVPGLPLILPQLLAGRDPRELVAAEGDLPSILNLGDRPRVLGGFLMGKVRLLAGLSPDECADIKRRASSQLSSVHRDEFLTAALAQAVADSDSDSAEQFVSALSAASSADPLAPWAVLRPALHRSPVRKLDRDTLHRVARRARSST